eukprot:scaffold80048_cov43-Cyclotella_meneghiniana.AAC.3
MAGSLEIAAQLPPNPTNIIIITNAFANTGSGVSSSDSASIAVANASRQWLGLTNHLTREG